MSTSSLAVATLATWVAAAPADQVSPAEEGALGETSLRLEWNVPTGCPDEGSVREQLLELVGGAPTRDLDARATITTDAGLWRLDLEIDRTSKSLTAASCEELARAAAVLLSIALELEPQDDERTQEEEDSPPAPSATDSETRRADPVTEPIEPIRTPPSSSGPRGLVRVEGAIQYGIAPSLSDAALVVGVALPRARFEIAGVFWTPADASLRFGDDRRALVTMGSVSTRGCGVLRTATLEFPLCGGLQLGTVRVDEITGGTRDVRHRFWAGVSASGALVWPFRRYLALWFGPEVIVSANRAPFELEGGTVGYQIGPAAIRGALGLEVRFP